MSSIRQEPLTTTEHIEKLKQFNATIAHELRNQLNTISVAVELLQYSREGASDKTIAILMNEIKHINRLVNDLHLLSLVEVQKLAITPHPMQMHAVMEDIVDAARARSVPTVLHYDCADDARSLSAYIDEERFRQAVDNLIDNAVRHSNTDDVVFVRVGRSADECVITVQDHGSGIPAGEIDYLFHRFYRASNARGKGSGLGLAIAQEIVQGHCGSIRIRSTLDVGTAIEIRLPLAPTPT
jgi:signal transduction histidine kinase